MGETFQRGKPRNHSAYALPRIRRATPAEDARTITSIKVSWGMVLIGMIIGLVIQLILNVINIGTEKHGLVTGSAYDPSTLNFSMGIVTPNIQTGRPSRKGASAT